MGSGAYFLAAFHKIAFDHESLDQVVDAGIVNPAVHNLSCDAGLLVKLFVGIGMVGVYNGGWVDQCGFIVFCEKQLQILIVIIGNVVSVLICCTAQNRVRQRISGCPVFRTSVDKGVRMLCGNNGVDHHRKITAGGVFHSGRDVKAGYGQPVLLVFYRPRADCHIGKEI